MRMYVFQLVPRCLQLSKLSKEPSVKQEFLCFALKMSKSSLSLMSTDELCAYLKQEIPNISDNIVKLFSEHKIDGEVFLELDDEYLKEVAPLLGDRLKLKRVKKAAIAISVICEFRARELESVAE